MLGGRLTTYSHGIRRPGFYVEGDWGGPIVEDPTDGGGAYSFGGGIAYSRVDPGESKWLPLFFGSLSLGVIYHHQEQFTKGMGDFLGLEVTATAGTNLEHALQKLLEGADDDD